ncbi:hypothetical protein LguiB_022823 [Lonicera macranthoides]
MRGAHGSTQNGRRLLEMLMGYPPTPHALFFTRSFILRPTPQPPSSSYAPPPPLRLSTTTTSISMSTVDQSSEGLDHLFKQKRILRSRVKRDLKSMDPTLRSQEEILGASIKMEAFLGYGMWFLWRSIIMSMACGGSTEERFERNCRVHSLDSPPLGFRWDSHGFLLI